MLRYLIGLFVTIGLIILLIVLLFSGGNDSSPTKTVPNSSKTLSSYAGTDAQVRLTIDGPINASQDHRQVQITVDKNNTTYNQFTGYDGTVTNSQTFATGQNDYSAFLHSLELLNFTKGNASDKSLKSESGHCATGQRYIFELIQGGHDIERFWATSCNGPHSYDGNVTSTLHLFQAQVPGYNDLVYSFGF